MKLQWARFVAWLEALSLRERAMVFAAGVALIGFLLWLGLLQPLVDRNHRLAAKLAGHNGLLATLGTQTDELRRLQAVDPDAVVRDQLADIDRQLAEIEDAMVQQQGGMVAPGQMAALVKGLLGRTPGLQLVGLRTLPVAPLMAPVDSGTAAKPAAGVETGLYQHGLDLTLEGRFGDLLAYATQLEGQPLHVLWSRTRIDALAYPKVTMTLTLYTLSLERTWLQL